MGKEYWYYITPDGVSYLFNEGKNRVVATDEGTGMPPIDYISQRGVWQHGETVIDFFLMPRIVQLLIRHQYCSRDDYWNGRSGLLNALRPNRGIPATLGRLRKINSLGQKRDLNVVIQQGPGFSPRSLDKWDEWAFTEELRFLAHNPVWYDPTSITVSYTFTADCNLIFPITFPIVFGSCSAGGTINYLGTWEEYPTIAVYGPIEDFSITNVTTGEKIAVGYQVLADQVMCVNLAYGVKSIILGTILGGSGTNLISYVTIDSDFVTWHLQPGNNVIEIEAAGVNANTRIDLIYYNRYIGI